MRDHKGLMDAMKAADVIFDPSGAEKAPFSTEVEMLLGGIPQVCYPDGTQQFMNQYVEPALVYSPRLFPGEMEEFCKANIAAYRAFNKEHGDDKLMSEDIPMVPFW